MDLYQLSTLLGVPVVPTVGYKSEGMISLDEFKGPGGTVTIEPGDEIDVLLESKEDDKGYVRLDHPVFRDRDRADRSHAAQPRPRRR